MEQEHVRQAISGTCPIQITQFRNMLNSDNQMKSMPPHTTTFANMAKLAIVGDHFRNMTISGGHFGYFLVSDKPFVNMAILSKPFQNHSYFRCPLFGGMPI